MIVSILRSAPSDFNSLLPLLSLSFVCTVLVLFSWDSTPTGIFTEEGHVPWIGVFEAQSSSLCHPCLATDFPMST